MASAASHLFFLFSCPSATRGSSCLTRRAASAAFLCSHGATVEVFQRSADRSAYSRHSIVRACAWLSVQTAGRGQIQGLRLAVGTDGREGSDKGLRLAVGTDDREGSDTGPAPGCRYRRPGGVRYRACAWLSVQTAGRGQIQGLRLAVGTDGREGSDTGPAPGCRYRRPGGVRYRACARLSVQTAGRGQIQGLRLG